MIKFFFKLAIVFIIALAAVIYHNTESGKKFEKKVGEEISFDKMSERGKDLIEKTIYFLSLKGLEYKKKKATVEKGPLKVNQNVEALPESAVESSRKKEIKKETTEKIGDEDRKRLEEILEQEG
ncbi:MAG: hypothetical protein OEV42_08220 [Deltaproteobacteria bacterium]|nr:hypothetical protein [Deltaproteobacteria bacterium]